MGNKIEIDSQVVLSNVGPKATVELAGEEKFYIDGAKEVEEEIEKLEKG